MPDTIIEVFTVANLNGQFAPHTGHIQPTVVGVPDAPPQDILHSADDVEGDIVHIKIANVDPDPSLGTEAETDNPIGQPEAETLSGDTPTTADEASTGRTTRSKKVI